MVKESFDFTTTSMTGAMMAYKTASTHRDFRSSRPKDRWSSKDSTCHKMAVSSTLGLPPTAFIFRQQESQRRSQVSSLQRHRPRVNQHSRLTSLGSQLSVTRTSPTDASQDIESQSKQVHRSRLHTIGAIIKERIQKHCLESVRTAILPVNKECLNDQRSCSPSKHPSKQILSSTLPKTNNKLQSHDVMNTVVFGKDDSNSIDQTSSNNSDFRQSSSRNLCDRCSAELSASLFGYDYTYCGTASHSDNVISTSMDTRRKSQCLQNTRFGKFGVDDESTSWKNSSELDHTESDGCGSFDEPVYEELADHDWPGRRALRRRGFFRHSRQSYPNSLSLWPSSCSTSSNDSWRSERSGPVKQANRQVVQIPVRRTASATVLTALDSGFHSESTTPSMTSRCAKYTASRLSLNSQISDAVTCEVAIGRNPALRRNSFGLTARPQVEGGLEVRTSTVPPTPAAAAAAASHPQLTRCESLDVPLFAIGAQDTWSRGGDSDCECEGDRGGDSPPRENERYKDGDRYSAEMLDNGVSTKGLLARMSKLILK